MSSASTHTPPKTLGAIAPRLEPFEVLIVEDNAADVTLLELLFSELQAPVRLHIAQDGGAGSDFVFKRGKYVDAPTPDLIFIDRNLPIKNGGELLQLFKESPEQRRIPVIMLTSSSSQREIEEAYQLGANAFISKPLDLDHYQQALRATCEFWFGCANLTTRQRPER